VERDARVRHNTALRFAPDSARDPDRRRAVPSPAACDARDEAERHMHDEREIELKLELDPSDCAVVLDQPILVGSALGPPEVRHLHTVYFDSRELALAGQGLSIRLRRSDGKQIQTVKFGEEGAAGLFSRGEIEVECAGERPDPEAIPDPAVRERVLDALGGQPLEPIFETEMKRTEQRHGDGTAEWSVAIDEGEVRAGFARSELCEIELELHAGATARLFEVALALSDGLPLWPGTRSKSERGHALRTGAPARPIRGRVPALAPGARADLAIQSLARACLAQIGANAIPAWEGVESEGVHQMRVGVRRLRALFSLVKIASPAARPLRARKQLKWLGGLLGEVRDLDVFLEERLRPLIARRVDDPALARLQGEALAVREERRRLLRAGLRSRRYTRLMLELGLWVETLGDRSEGTEVEASPMTQPVEALAEGALSRLHRKVEKLGGRALAATPGARHELRVAVKRLRYACEFFASLYEAKGTRRYVKRLARLQDELGRLNDADTAGHLLRELSARGEPERAIDLARAAGFIEGCSMREDDAAAARLERRWARLRKAHPFWQPRASE